MADKLLSVLDTANLLAGQAVAAAQAFLGGRSDAATLVQEAWRIDCEENSFVLDDPQTRGLLRGVRLLTFVCHNLAEADQAAAAGGDALEMRKQWESVANEAIKLLRHQSGLLLTRKTDLRRAELQRELDVLTSLNADAPEWGAASGARSERIAAIRRELAGATEPRG